MKGGSEQQRVKDHAAWIADHGFDGVRVLYSVDWVQQPYGGRIRGSVAALREFLDCFYGEYGLRTKVTAQASANEPTPLVLGQEVVEAVQGREAAVLMLEGVNEQYAASLDQAVMLAASLMASHVPVSVGWGTDDVHALKDITLRAGVNVLTKHLERTPPAQRRDRQCWDFHYAEPYAGDNGEPAGPASTVSSEADPFHLATQRYGGIIMGAGNYCFHTGSMVYGVRYDHPTAGPRYANIWDIPNVEAMVSALRGVDAVVQHTGVENWRTTNTQIPIEVVAGAVDKQYYALSPAKDVLGILTGTAGTLAFRENRPMESYALVDPSTGQEVGRDAGLRAYAVRGRTL